MTTITLPGDYQPSVKSLLKAPKKIQGRIISPDVVPLGLPVPWSDQHTLRCGRVPGCEAR